MYKGYDVALMVLDKPVTRVKPVTLANCNQDYTDIEGKKKGLVAGWGITNPDDGNNSIKIFKPLQLNLFCLQLIQGQLFYSVLSST